MHVSHCLARLAVVTLFLWLAFPQPVNAQLFGGKKDVPKITSVDPKSPEAWNEQQDFIIKGRHFGTKKERVEVTLTDLREPNKPYRDRNVVAIDDTNIKLRVNFSNVPSEWRVDIKFLDKDTTVSHKFKVVQPKAPKISGVRPSRLEESSEPQTFEIRGSSFRAGKATVTLRNLTTQREIKLSSRDLIFCGGEIIQLKTVMLTAGDWEAIVINDDGQQARPKSFKVSAPPTPKPIRAIPPPSPSPSYILPDYKNARIQGQGAGTQLCLAAVYAMVEINRPGGNVSLTPQDFWSDKGAVVKKGIPWASSSAAEHRQQINLERIRSELRKGRPVILEGKYPIDRDRKKWWDHYVLVIGYESDTDFIILDPIDNGMRRTIAVATDQVDCPVTEQQLERGEPSPHPGIKSKLGQREYCITHYRTVIFNK